ncbi:MATE family efflux transporter [Romboutsia lituseburensis]|uniref:MATE family efflux transporter n=1 Tax=Romboutsia lituseburensis TaxID=1537 RepID=UPI00215A10E4|nr:MATE family efflux transporter [Romboutsia lituseburensis]MCR8745118.1 MATE family efflux transporter [Romboutsia lituseburensis]
MENIKDLKTQFKKYVIPSVTAMWVFSLYSMVDGIFVSKGVGSDALAAVNISTPYINTIFALSILFSTGATTIVSMTLGNGDNKKANEYFTLNTVTVTILSAIIIIFSLFNLDKLAVFLGATNSTIDYVKEYLGTIILFVGFYIVSYSLEVLIKSDGYPHLATIGVLISAITNIVLDYIFVIQLNYGVQGAAFATGIARVLSFSFFFIHFLRKKGRLQFVKFKFDFNILKRIVSIGIPDFTTEVSLAIVVLIFNQSILRVIGEGALVSYSVICYINILVLTTMMGISQGIQPICSYYYGKKDKKAVLSILNMGLKSAKISSIVAFLIVVIFTKPIVLMFISNSDKELFTYTVNSLRIFSFAFLVMGYNVVTAGFCVSINKPIYAGAVSLGRGMVVIIATLGLMVILFGGIGIWISTFISEVIVMIYARKILSKCKNDVENKKEDVELVAN